MKLFKFSGVSRKTGIFCDEFLVEAKSYKSAVKDLETWVDIAMYFGWENEEEVDRMKAGDDVIIYMDPITQKEIEGTARLIERIREDPDGSGTEIWSVRFGDEEPVPRTIYKGAKHD